MNTDFRFKFADPYVICVFIVVCQIEKRNGYSSTVTCGLLLFFGVKYTPDYRGIQALVNFAYATDAADCKLEHMSTFDSRQPCVHSALCCPVPLFPQPYAVPSFFSLSLRMSRPSVPSAIDCPVSLFPQP